MSSSQVRTAIARTHEWFEGHSGWAPPDAETLAELAADGVGRAPDDCLVTPDGICEHGLASWALVLADVDGRAPAVSRDDRPGPRR